MSSDSGIIHACKINGDGTATMLEGQSISDKMNRNMYVLSVIAAIFLPLGFLTGLLGINVGGIPGAENPAAFWIFIMMMTVIVGLQIYIFKKLKWF